VKDAATGEKREAGEEGQGALARIKRQRQ
jgi:hypothetical protein